MATQITSVSAKINIGGTETSIDGFTYNSSTGYWEKQVSAPSTSSYLNNDGHYYPVSVTANDAAGNSATASVNEFDSLKLYVTESDAPTVSLSGINAGTTTSNAKPTINITVTDSNSGISTSNAYVKIDSGTQTSITLTKTNNNKATGSFTPTTALSDGQHTITVYAQDNDGNTGNSSVTFTVLTSAPSLTVSTPATESTVTNNSTVVVSGSTNTGTGNTVEITLNGASQGGVTVDSNGNFSKSITLSSDGTYTIVVTATNAAGTPTTVTRTVTLDTQAPVFTEVVINPNPVNLGSVTTYTIRVKVQ